MKLLGCQLFFFANWHWNDKFIDDVLVKSSIVKIFLSEGFQ